MFTGAFISRLWPPSACRVCFPSVSKQLNKNIRHKAKGAVWAAGRIQRKPRGFKGPINTVHNGEPHLEAPSRVRLPNAPQMGQSCLPSKKAKSYCVTRGCCPLIHLVAVPHELVSPHGPCMAETEGTMTIKARMLPVGRLCHGVHCIFG